MPVRAAIIPALRYTDAPRAIEFLCRAFGFKEHIVYPEPENSLIIAHAQLVRDGQMIMLSSVSSSAFAKAAPMRTVAEAGGNTMSLYVVLDDLDGHATVARENGADIFMEPEDQAHGGRTYTARDLEGNCWTFGNYDPFAD